jgi:hypothetical protein
MAEKSEKLVRAGVEIDPDTGNVVAKDAPAAPEAAEQPKEGNLKRADAETGPFVNDAEHEDAPLRTARPDVPIVQTLKSGAGAHQFVSDERFDVDGRYVGDQAEKLEAAAARDQDAATDGASGRSTAAKKS